MCFAIEYAKTFPKLLGWFSLDPVVAQDPNDGGFADDEDVAAEVLRVKRMGGLLGEEEGEVVLRGLRKVYRTQQASRKKEEPPHRRKVRLPEWDVFLSFHVILANQTASMHVAALSRHAVRRVFPPLSGVRTCRVYKSVYSVS